MRLYQRSRRNRLLTGTNLGLVGGSGVVTAPTSQTWPVWYNFGGDAVSEVGSDLWAKSTHYDGRDEATVRLDDYGVILAAAPTGIDQCFFGPGATSPYAELLLTAGEGWTPSGGGTIRSEMIIAGGGTGAQAYFYFQDSAKQEGVFFLLLGNGLGIVRTQGGGTLSGNLLSTSTGRTPFNWKYFSFQVSYSFSTKTCYYRLLPLNHSDWADTGWVNIGTIGSPTYASGTEQLQVQVNPYNSTTDQLALGQISLGQATDSDNDGVVRTHNYAVWS